MKSAVWACVGLTALLSANSGVAGQIVIDPKVSNPPAKEAPQPSRVVREPRRPVEVVLPASAVIMDGEDEEGFFPQHGDDSLLDEKARASREGAKEQLQQGIVPPNAGAVEMPDTNARDGVAGNLSKARAYMKNTTSQRISELPVVSCNNVDNVTGRIGDDSQSGSIITIMVNGKQVKARCK